jgi:DNA polymerase III epsilon subunit-like protein
MARKKPQGAIVVGAIDFETTGLPLAPAAPAHLQPRAIEFAVCVAQIAPSAGLKILKEDAWVIYPERTIEPIITKITGLTDEVLLRAPVFAEVWPLMRKALNGCDLLVAHNMSFDAFILAHELRLLGATWPWPPLCCTVQMFEPRFGYRPKLVQLYEHLTGKQYVQTHRALDDVRALTEIIAHGTTPETLAAVATAHGAFLPPELRTNQ